MRLILICRMIDRVGVCLAGIEPALLFNLCDHYPAFKVCRQHIFKLFLRLTFWAVDPLMRHTASNRALLMPIETIDQAKALEIAHRIKICDKHFDPIRESATHFPEDDINNFSDDMLPFFVSFDERAQYALYQWIHNPPKRWEAWCVDDMPNVTDDFYNMLGTMSVTKERETESGTIFNIRLHSYNRFDYHGTYHVESGTVRLIANRKFW